MNYKHEFHSGSNHICRNQFQCLVYYLSRTINEFDFNVFRYKEYFSKNITYNSSNIAQWNVNDGYSADVKDKILLDVVPARINGIGYHNRLTLTIYMYPNDFIRCSSSFNDGFLVSKIEHYHVFITENKFSRHLR